MPEAIQLAASEWVALGFQGRTTGRTFSSKKAGEENHQISGLKSHTPAMASGEGRGHNLGA